MTTPPNVAYIDSTAPQWGIAGNGVTDDTAAWQALIKAAPNRACILISPTQASVITSTLKVYRRYGLHFLNMGGCDTWTRGQRGGEFLWQGPIGQDSVFDCNYGRRIKFTGVTLSCDWPTPPACGFRFDQWSDPSQSGGTTANCTMCQLNDCIVIAPAVAGTFYGADFGRVSPTNVDLMTVRGLTVQGTAAQGWGEGVRVGPFTNRKGYVLERVWTSGASAGIHFLAGSGTIRDCGGTGDIADIQHDDIVDYLSIEGCNYESTTGLALSLTGSAVPATVRNCRWGNLAGLAAIQAANGPGLALVDNYFQAVLVNGVPFTNPFTNAPPNGSILYRSGNRWVGMVPGQLRTFGFPCQGAPDTGF